MYDGGSVFGQRVVLLDHPPVRLPGPVLLPAGQIRPGRGAPTVRSQEPAGQGGVWLPGSDPTVRGRADHAVRPELQRRRADAARALGIDLKDQGEPDVAAEARLAPPEADELRYAQAALDLGAWRYRIEHCPPGPELAGLLEQRPTGLRPAPGCGAVIGAEFDTIPGGAEPADRAWPDAVLATVVAREKLISHLQAAQYADIAELSGCYTGIHQFLATELALALHTTDADAAVLLGTAETLRDRLPATQAALAAGTITDAKANALVRAAVGSTPQVAAAVEQAVLPGAATATVTTVRRRATRALIAADPDGTADRHRRQRKERHVYRRPEEDGMARLGVYAPAQDIATIWEAVTAVADAVRGPDDTRTLGQRRVDALVMICTDILSAGGWTGLKLPDKQYGRPRINITVPYTVLLGHRAACELAGHGPIPTEQALPLIGAGELHRLICDPITGQLLDYGHERYRPPPHLAAFVRTRDGECPAPTCHQPADRGQLDHIVPARPDPVTGKPTHGTTCADNLAAPCQHHHLSKDAGRGYTLHRATDGTYTWTTPLGRTYTWRPDPPWHPDTDSLTSYVDTDPDPGGDGAGRDEPGPARSCSCLPRTGPDSRSDTRPDGNHGPGEPAEPADSHVGTGAPADRRLDTGASDAPADGRLAPAEPGDSDVPICDCPDTCPCQHGPQPDPYDLIPPLTIHGPSTDWDDGFAADPDTARDIGRLYPSPPKPRATRSDTVAIPDYPEDQGPGPDHPENTGPGADQPENQAPTPGQPENTGPADDPPPF